jgi:uncharacterized delta-60 repeat protein
MLMKKISLLIICCITSIIAQGQTLDSTFGDPLSFFGGYPFYPVYGTMACDFPGYRTEFCRSSFLLDDEKIILAGSTYDTTDCDFALVRLLPDGTYDNLFGVNGQIRFDLGFQYDSCLIATRYDSDRMLMAGSAYVNNQNKALIIRINNDGVLDTTFGQEGVVLIDLPSTHEIISELLVQTSGKIIIAGNARYGDNAYSPDSTVFFLSRLSPNGQIDSTFSTNGIRYQKFEYSTCKAAIIEDMVTDGEGRIIVTGASYLEFPYVSIDAKGCSHNIHVLRFTEDGLLDTSFGNAGVVEILDGAGSANALYQYEDGRILLAGIEGIVGSVVNTIVMRLHENGDIDSTFGINGRFRKLFVFGDIGAVPYDIIVFQNKIILSVISGPDISHVRTGLIGLAENGILDTTFGSSGGRWFFPDYGLPAYPNWYERLVNMGNIIQSGPSSLLISGSYQQVDYLSNENDYLLNMFIYKINYEPTSSTIMLPSGGVKNIDIYPNPTTGQITLSNLPAGEKQVRVYNATGQVCMEVQTDAESLDLSSQTSGIYFIQVLDDNGQMYRSKPVVLMK